MGGECGFPLPVEMPMRHRWVKEWSNEKVDRKSVWMDLHRISKRLVGNMHERYGGVREADEHSIDVILQSEQADLKERRVDLSSTESSTMSAQEDGQERSTRVEL